MNLHVSSIGAAMSSKRKDVYSGAEVNVTDLDLDSLQSLYIGKEKLRSFSVLHQYCAGG
jgi:hypothetical protein